MGQSNTRHWSDLQIQGDTYLHVYYIYLRSRFTSLTTKLIDV